MSGANVIIKLRQGADPAADRTVTEDDNSRTFYVAVPDESVERFGGFDPGDAARVIEAIDASVPVGIPSYGYAETGRR